MFDHSMHVKRVPMRHRDGRVVRNPLGVVQYKLVYDGPKASHHHHEEQRRKEALRRQDVQIAHQAAKMGRPRSEAFEYELHNVRGPQSLIMDIHKNGDTDHERRVWARENVPNSWAKDPKTRAKGDTVRQSLRWAWHETAVKEALKQGWNITDPGRHETNYWNGFAEQVGQKVRDPDQRRRLGDLMEMHTRGQLHPKLAHALSSSVDVNDGVRVAEAFHRRGIIKDRAPPFRPELRQVLKFLIKQPERRVALNGTVRNVAG